MTSGKVTICHHTGSGSNPFVTITVSVNALPAHLAHGDTIGACGTTTTTTTTTGTTTTSTSTSTGTTTTTSKAKVRGKVRPARGKAHRLRHGKHAAKLKKTKKTHTSKHRRHRR